MFLSKVVRPALAERTVTVSVKVHPVIFPFESVELLV